MKKFSIFLYYVISILYLEVIYRFFVYKHISKNMLFSVLFIVSISLLISLISKYFKKKTSYIINIVIMLFITILYTGNFIYYKLFSVPFSISTLSLANQAVDFHNILFTALSQNIFYLLCMFIPFICLVVLKRKFKITRFPRTKYKYFALVVILYIFGILLILPFKDANKYYFKVDNLDENINYFGLISATRLNITRNIFGFDQELVIRKLDNKKIENHDYTANVLDIDFNSLMNNTSDEKEKMLYNYFANEVPTYQNEYTGMYKDKNLIFILAEGFNSIAVSKELTPTLYKLTHTGFVFNNYYSPVFLSTTGGEFQATTSLIPTQEILELWRSNNPTFTYSLGNTFNSLGYNVNAYHNWTYTYYKRNVTMKTLGFDSYTGCGNGMETMIRCKWLPSDIELIDATYPLYGNNDRFMTYYVSVSGHAPYNFGGGNPIAYKNKDLVKDLNYSEPVKAYIASQIEFDKAMESLIKHLEDTGKIDDTVIVITGDHYPYTLTLDEINEVSSYKRDDIEVNHSNLIIWNNNDSIIKEIDKVGSQIDVLPTILNLFGIKYDSRLLVGNDILSKTEGLAIFSNHSFVSDSGRYNATTKEFIKNNNAKITSDYLPNMNSRIDNSFIVSKMILETDIYKKILNK